MYNNQLYVAAHQDEMRRQSAQERLAAEAASTNRPATDHKARLSDAVRSAWSFLTGPADRPLTPTLINYPFRG